MIRFFSSAWLWLLVVLPSIALWRGRQGDTAVVRNSNTQLVRAVSRTTRGRRDAWLTGLTLLALALLILGLARPQIGGTRAEVQIHGSDVMLLLDVSGSMRSRDFQLDGKPASRVDVVKSVVANFIQARPNDRIGLSIFAAVPYLVSPPTLDHAWLRQNLERVQISTAEDGTAIGSAIATGVNRLRDPSAGSKLIMLLTSGRNKVGKVSPLAAAQAARALGIRVYTIDIGVGDEHLLHQIANTTGAQFYRATDTEALHRICTDVDRLEKPTAALKSYAYWQELYGWFLIPGLVLLSLSNILQQSRWRRLSI